MRPNISRLNAIEYLKMDTLTPVELWRTMEEAFIRPRNITFDRFSFLQQSSQRESPSNISLAN